MEDENYFRFNCSFDSAVAILSIHGYYLDGYVDDPVGFSNESIYDRYKVKIRTSEGGTKKGLIIGYIFRDGGFEFETESVIERRRVQKCLVDELYTSNSGSSKKYSRKVKTNPEESLKEEKKDK